MGKYMQGTREQCLYFTMDETMPGIEEKDFDWDTTTVGTILEYVRNRKPAISRFWMPMRMEKP